MKKTANLQIGLLILIYFLSLQNLSAEVRLPHIFGSDMVLQREKPVNIWGWADTGEKITIAFNDQKVKVKADKNGKWSAALKPMEAGGPFNMSIKGKNEITLDNILLGDVWICSGQSNMEWIVANSNNAEEEIINANYPEIRLYKVPKNLKFKPVEDVESKWKECTPDNVRNFSAVGYFFGRYVHNETGVPIGLINTSWGGTVVETWISKESIASVGDFDEKLEQMKNFIPEEIEAQMKKKFEELKAKIGDAKGIIDGEAVWADPELDESDWLTMELPGLWEQKGLSDLDGIIWFRREFVLSEKEVQKGVVLKLGPIDDSDITWVNGYEVGRMTDKYDIHRKYMVSPDKLKVGRNIVVVRVEDNGGGGGMYGSPRDFMVETSEKSIPLEGEWKYRISADKLSIKINASSPNSFPTLLYNGMIKPLVPYTLTGAIWYQGESNASRAYQYRTLFPLLIKDWRKQWNQGDFPFLFVQLANFREPAEVPKDDAWAELREAQSMTLSLPNTGMAVTIDIGEADDIHPRNKQEVGRRLGLAARKIAYGEDIVYSGPMYKSMTIEGDKIRLALDHVGSGLKIKDKYGYLKGFAIAGEDKQFKWAKAYLDGNTVVVYNKEIKDPVAVRYAWGTNPDDANLYNEEGLPASPFRTDDWKGMTYGVK